jgi:hypothetical protein
MLKSPVFRSSITEVSKAAMLIIYSSILTSGSAVSFLSIMSSNQFHSVSSMGSILLESKESWARIVSSKFVN